MHLVYTLVPLLVLTTQLSFCNCNLADFQANVDGFMNAFDDVYSTEVISPTTDELPTENDIVQETSVPEEGTPKDYEDPPATQEVQEGPVVTETVFQPGSQIRHDINEDLVKMAARVVASISPDLELVNISEAMSMVTDKVERSFMLRVTRRDCEDDCSVECRVDLISRGDEDTVTWHNCLETNEVPRIKRGAVGGFKQVDEAEAQELAEIAAQTLDTIDADDVKRVVTQVIRAQKQLVNGIMYHLTLEMALSDCKEGDEKCQGKLSDYNICKILMQRLFSGEAPHNAQVIKSECNPISKAKDIENKKQEQKRGKRHVGNDGTESNMIITSNHASSKKSYKHRTMGGKMRQDPNSDHIKEISEFALAEIDKSSNSLNKQKIVRVVEAESQVVSGVKYFLKMELVETNCRKGSNQESCSPLNDQVLQSCEVVVWDKPWEKFRAVTRVQCSPVNSRRKRALLGGKTPADVTNERVKEMAKYAVTQLDAQSNSLNTQKLVEVKEAQTQVVAGTNYYLKLQLVETNCRKGSEANGPCNALADKPIQECDIVVYDRPWDKHREMTSAKCTPLPTISAARNKRELAIGGNFPQEKDSDDIKDMAEFAVEDMSKRTNSMFKKALVEVISAETQIVSGVNYHLKLRVADSNCKKNNADAKNCSPADDSKAEECEVTVWSQPWMNKRSVTKSICKDVQDKQAVGGLKMVDPLSPEVLGAAKLSLKRIDSGSNSMYKHALIRVIDSKVQTVSGKKYFLTIEVGESECTKNNNKEDCAIRPDNLMNDRCNVVVWDRPWLGQKEVLSVNCGKRDKRLVAQPTSGTPVDVNDVHVSMFEEFKTKYNKVYATEEEHQKRFRIFRANLKKIKALQDTEQGTAVYGPNMFADLSEKEFKRRYLGLKRGPAPKPSGHHMTPATIPSVELPVEFDWREHGAVTSVKNQGQCGSCWAFSVTGNVEGQWFLKHGKLLSLSEQELVDCDKRDDGCMGGYMTQAYEAIEELGGLETEDEYPYEAENESCKFNKSEVRATVASSVNITTNETQIAQWLYKNGPISIGINANAMQFYMGGVSHPFKFLCSKDQLDHGVLLVGFGVHRSTIRHKMLPYWTVKNSWGPHWGEKGYYRVYRGDGTCGVNQMASSAIVD